jgi:hypothetical protein
MHRVIFACLFLSAACFGADTIQAFGLRWQVPIASDWKVENVDGGCRLDQPDPVFRDNFFVCVPQWTILVQRRFEGRDATVTTLFS